jgi:glutathione S-transferase
MKIYDVKDFPNPRRVRIFLAEKGVTDITYQQVNFSDHEHRQPDYLKKNPYGGIPVLELDDGTCISESLAICRYFEEQAGGPKLMGTNPEEKARIEMWSRRIEDTILNRALAFFHHATDGLGSLETYQNKDWGIKSKELLNDGLRKLDEQLAEKQFAVGDDFTLADITAVCSIDLVTWLGIDIPDEFVNITRWYDFISSRPSLAA